MPTVTAIDSAASASGPTSEPAPATAWHDAEKGLRLLALYRFITPLFQAGTMLIVAEQFKVSVASGPVVAMLMVELLVAVATLARLKLDRKVGALELQLHATVDIGLFTAMLYFTGGTANPFAPLFVLPVMIVSMALPPSRLWLLVVLTMGCYAALREHHVPLSHPQGAGELRRLHENGMIVNYMLSSAMLMLFSTRLVASLRRHAKQACDAREAQMRNEAVATIGGLAAGAAHELASPIGTVAVIASELRHRYPADPHLQDEVKLIESQLLSCKQILARMANAGDVRRAESASAADLDEFIRSTVQCIQAANPGASVEIQFEGARPVPRIVVEDSLRQSLYNIVQNAVWASPQRVQVTATWGRAWFEVTVSDCGPGFSDELLAALGKGLIRSRWPERGLGMGLLLGAQATQLLGGSLDFKNNATGGARVQLRVPLGALSIDPAPGSPRASE